MYSIRVDNYNVVMRPLEWLSSFWYVSAFFTNINQEKVYAAMGISERNLWDLVLSCCLAAVHDHLSTITRIVLYSVN